MRETQLSFSDALSLGGLVVSLLGIPLTVYYSQRGRERPILGSAVDTQTLVRPYIGPGTNLVLRFRSVQISRIVRTTVAVWNERGNTIRSADVVAVDPIRVELAPGDNILTARILSISRPQNRMSIDIPSSDRARLDITFDFLDEDDGGIIEILHQVEAVPTVSGTVEGGSHKDFGTMNLSASALEEKKDRSVASRSRRAVRKQSSTWLLLALLTMSVGGGVIDLIPSALGREAPKLVDPNQFDLTSLAGQQEFQRAVSESGIYEPTQPAVLSWILVVVYSLVVIGYIVVYILGRSNRTRLPRRLTDNYESR